MTFVLDVIQVFISIMLVFLVLMHSGKDSGLSGFGMGGGTGGGSGPFGGGGGSLVERNLNRWTVLFGVLFAVNTIVLVKVG